MQMEINRENSTKVDYRDDEMAQSVPNEDYMHLEETARKGS